MRYLLSGLIILMLVCGRPVCADMILLQANTFGADCGKPVRVTSTNNGWAATYPRDNKVVIFGSDGSKVTEITGLGAPLGIAFSAPDTLYVGEQNPACVSVWQTNGTKLGTIGDGMLAKPSSIALDATTNRLYVLDSANRRVRVLSTAGALLLDIGDASRLLNPSGITLDATNNTVLVGETITGVMHSFSPGGTWLRDIGTFGTGQGQFMRVGGMGYTDPRMITVADPFLSQVQILDTDGGFLAREGSFGSGDDQLSTPLDVATAPGRRLAVADFGNGRLVEYWIFYNSANDAQAQPNSTFVNLVGPIVTAGTADFGTSIYVEADDRRSGIRVDNVSGTIDRGALMQISGTIATENGERCIKATSVESIFGWVVPAPFGMPAGGLGGMSPFSAVPLIDSSFGAYNVGLLVRVWGRVARVDGDDFYIGTGVNDQSWVHAPGIAKPAEGANVTVTGICSTGYDIGGLLRPRVLPRDAADILDVGGN